MNRIVFVSENKRKIEQITAILNSRDDMNFQLLSTSHLLGALNDIRAFKAEFVIMDGLSEGVSERILDLSKNLQMVDSIFKKILLTDEETLRHLSDDPDTYFDEYVIYDEQLEQLFSKRQVSWCIEK